LLLHPACRDAESASAHKDVSIVAATIPNLTPLFSIPSAGVRLPSQQLLQNCCKISEISSEEKKPGRKSLREEEDRQKLLQRLSGVHWRYHSDGDGSTHSRLARRNNRRYYGSALRGHKVHCARTGDGKDGVWIRKAQ
jgi:hypothetical protein